MVNFIHKVFDILPYISILIASIAMLVSIITGKKPKGIKGIDLVQMINQKLRDSMCRAENFDNWTGEEKKEWVLSRIENFLQINSIDYPISKIEQTLEELITLSKKVNKRDKDIESDTTNPDEKNNTVTY